MRMEMFLSSFSNLIFKSFMKNIIGIINEVVKPHNDLKIIIRDNKVILYKRFLFKIILFSTSEEELNINSQWESGLLGKLFFNKDLKLMQSLVSELIEIFQVNRISVKEVIMN